MTILESIEQARQNYLNSPKWQQALTDDFIDACLAPDIIIKETYETK